MPACLRAFTLIEMLVSLAVLMLALAIVGVVFSVTAKTASQSAAYTETHNLVRHFMQQIEEDLDACDPANSILVLVGRTQTAALTQADLDAGKFHRVLVGDPYGVPPGYDPNFALTIDANGNYSDPRADLLMFFSNRPTASIAPPRGLAAPPDSNESPYLYGFKNSPVLVVYGHAALGEPVWTGSQFSFPPANQIKHIEQFDPSGRFSMIPANRWHLSRRATIIRPVTNPNTLTFSSDEWDRISQCYAGTHKSEYGDVGELDLAQFLANLGPDEYPPPYPPYPPVSYSPYMFGVLGGEWPGGIQSQVKSLLYSSGSEFNHHVTTVLEEVPTELSTNLGVHMLPGCAWFQVEFLMPEDPVNSAYYSSRIPSSYRRADLPRWTSINANPSAGATTNLFVPDTEANRAWLANLVSPNGRPYDRLAYFARLDPSKADDVNAVQNRIIRLWPYALRITVRVYDPRGRLPEPIVRSIVHRFE